DASVQTSGFTLTRLYHIYQIASHAPHVSLGCPPLDDARWATKYPGQPPRMLRKSHAASGDFTALAKLHDKGFFTALDVALRGSINQHRPTAAELYGDIPTRRYRRPKMQLHCLAGTWFPVNAHVCRTMRAPREEIIRGALKVIRAVATYFGIVHAVPGGIDKQCALSKFQAGPNQLPRI